MATLAIATDKVCTLVYLMRQRQGKVSPQDVPGPDGSVASNEAEDEFREIVEDLPDDNVEDEIRGIFEAMNVDERVDLLALMWIGRGDFDAGELTAARREAAAQANAREPDYMLGSPLVADYIENALNDLGHSCSE